MTLIGQDGEVLTEELFESLGRYPLLELQIPKG